MSDQNKPLVAHDNDLVKAVYVQLMEQIREQDTLIQSWTKYYLSIQAGLAVALAFLVKLGQAEGFLVNAGSLFMPLLGIATVVVVTNIILRELFWQGRYVAQVCRLPKLPETFRQEWVGENPDMQKRGFIPKQFNNLRILLVLAWVVLFTISVIRMYGTP